MEFSLLLVLLSVLLFLAAAGDKENLIFLATESHVENWQLA